MLGDSIQVVVCSNDKNIIHDKLNRVIARKNIQNRIIDYKTNLVGMQIKVTIPESVQIAPAQLNCS